MGVTQSVQQTLNHKLELSSKVTNTGATPLSCQSVPQIHMQLAMSEFVQGHIILQCSGSQLKN